MPAVGQLWPSDDDDDDDDDDKDDDDVEHLAVSSGWSDDSCSGKRKGRRSKCTFN